MSWNQTSRNTPNIHNIAHPWKHLCRRCDCDFSVCYILLVIVILLQYYVILDGAKLASNSMANTTHYGWKPAINCQFYKGLPVWLCLSVINSKCSKKSAIVHVSLNTFRPRQDGQHCPDDIFKCIFLNENVSILIKISLKFVRKGPINNIPALVQIMAWHRPGDKPLSEPMMV